VSRRNRFTFVSEAREEILGRYVHPPEYVEDVLLLSKLIEKREEQIKQLIAALNDAWPVMQANGASQTWRDKTSALINTVNAGRI
jgi:hypothetical protein